MQKSHQKDKHQDIPICKIPEIILKIDERGTQINGQKDKKVIIGEMAQTDSMYQEKKEEDELQALRIALMQDSKTISIKAKKDELKQSISAVPKQVQIEKQNLGRCKLCAKEVQDQTHQCRKGDPQETVQKITI